MSCKHLMWGHYCKKRHEFCQDSFEDREELCVNCSDYKDENEVTDLKKIFNKGPAADIVVNLCCSNKYSSTTTCENEVYKPTAENDYVSMLAQFLNNCYPHGNFRFFELDAIRAEEHACNDMQFLGYNTKMVIKALVHTRNNFKTNHASCIFRLESFCKSMLRKLHKDYANYHSNNFRFVLALILGYLDKLDSIAIIDCDDPRSYFKDKVSEVIEPNLMDAVNKTRLFVKASNDNNLAEGMRMVELWFEELAKENIPAKELTIADIEKQLGI